MLYSHAMFYRLCNSETVESVRPMKMVDFRSAIAKMSQSISQSKLVDLMNELQRGEVEPCG